MYLVRVKSIPTQCWCYYCLELEICQDNNIKGHNANQNVTLSNTRVCVCAGVWGSTTLSPSVSVWLITVFLVFRDFSLSPRALGRRNLQGDTTALFQFTGAVNSNS